ncbi:Uncharacterised protein [Mycobacteroides abscessus subsp. abscessus]|nr:Uncharacterised protein [Mycobacteroides abscessus subsp. abscessus]
MVTSFITCEFSALSALGRFSVMTATRSMRSVRMVSKLCEVMTLLGFARRSPRSLGRSLRWN